ncbi:TPA: hypothetical protein N0F65_009561 [Lagenidium giganteum]|uniref:Elicitin-like protein n=1 Tax=Lagenidium giganteum TaxID=4803 RepID=A0AAV2YSG7_9STRA|nr:TPA: hypothetical protein N0F65_009561 [Lagenidium giganteum]
MTSSPPSSGASMRRRRQYERVWTLATVVVFGAALLMPVAHAAVCSTDMQADLQKVVKTRRSLFASCLSDLKMPKDSALTAFIDSKYLDAKTAATICEQDSCVGALIAAMEELPDCCWSADSSKQNLPRLANDILNQCDIISAKQLAKELEREIAKLDDLKVQIKSVVNGSANSSSSSNGSVASSDGGVDIIIDVKKRELMKSGEGFVSRSSRDGQGNGNDNGHVLSSATHLVSASAVVLVVSCLLQALAL